ncbi:FRG domain-containing protein [Devosia lacusdianchii]|uniref:FRG domain-containing protein n=1 Tax=Devosia lacusdianchii TaxID=2917991 RepID=UPI001F064436|nr:FRG domain-containing protein [Devosia sp. JXJ CY 41]
MRTYVLSNPSIAELFAIIEREPGGYRHVFRGQGDATWPLIPSIYRTRPNIIGGPAKEAYDHYEMEGINRFYREAMPYLPSIDRNQTNDRVLAQHFGVPTSLLDWSHDPLVALFFAVENRRANCDAALFMLLPDARVSPDIMSLGTYQAFEISPPAIDRRIPAQKSVFTMHPYGDPKAPFVPIDQRPDMGSQITDHEGKVTRGFAKIVIAERVKPLLRGVLFAMGIDRRNLFPGLDGVGQHIADRTSWVS